MLFCCWPYFVNVQRRTLQILRRVHDGGHQDGLRTIGVLLVLLQSKAQDLTEITSRCAEAALQLAASFISGPSPRCRLLAGADEVIELSDDFRLWPLAEGRLSACHVGCQGQTGRRSNLASTAAFDPKRTWLDTASLAGHRRVRIRRTPRSGISFDSLARKFLQYPWSERPLTPGHRYSVVAALPSSFLGGDMADRKFIVRKSN